MRFLTAISPTSTVSNLVFTLRSDKTALLGADSLIEKQLAIISDEIRRPYLEINAISKRGLVVSSNNAAINSIFDNFGGGDVTTQVFTGGSGRDLGTPVSFTQRRATGVLCSATSTGNNVGISSYASQGINNSGGRFTVSAANSSNVSNYGVFASATGSDIAGTINNGIFASASGANALAGNFAGAVACTSLNVTSDKSLKTNIKKEDRVLEMLEKINPVTYNYINQKENTRLNLSEKLQNGFIAQELQDIMPELVQDIVYPIFDDKNEQIGTKILKSVNYIGLISVLTASIKELSQELKALKADKHNASKTFVLTDSNTKQFTKQELKVIQEKGYYLAQNTPNPFSSSTLIDYSLPQTDKNASILILNLNGQIIKTIELIESKGNVIIEAGSLQSGMYLYSLISDGVEIVTKKMIVK